MTRDTGLFGTAAFTEALLSLEKSGVLFEAGELGRPNVLDIPNPRPEPSVVCDAPPM